MFSTTIGCPSVRDTPSAKSRAITSVAAPGPVGTISLIGRLGHVCAFPSAASMTSAQPSNTRKRTDTASLSFPDPAAQCIVASDGRKRRSNR
jgi:hypothetical protein